MVATVGMTGAAEGGSLGVDNWAGRVSAVAMCGEGGRQSLASAHARFHSNKPLARARAAATSATPMEAPRFDTGAITRAEPSGWLLPLDEMTSETEPED